ncbi:MAG TPA: TlyA family RNA methyltransferase [Caulobacteraceae bacterium]|nr:TlyA family RNA methyltransferase [Caulobacteraceae bacterium]
MKKRLDVVLVGRGLAESRAKARAAIEAGQVRVDGVAAARASDLVGEGAAIEAAPAHPWVGRGALKLDHALTLWPVQVAGRTVLDVGASTGGFTEVCLARGAARVFAVDVGRDQLHPRLRGDPRVVSLEGTDARRLDRTLVPDAVDLVVCDASFISLAKVLPAALDLAREGADLVALVKPQFEAGPDAVGKGGLVRDPAVREATLRAVQDFLQAAGWPVQATAESPIRGGDGNAEFLVWARKA